MNLHNMTTNQLIAFIRLHTQSKYESARVGTNPVTVEEIDLARKLIRSRNRTAFIERKFATV